MDSNRRRNSPALPAMANASRIPPAYAIALWRWEAMKFNPARLLAFYLGLALVFLRFSMLHELLSWLAGFRLYLLNAIGAPAILGVLLTGGVRRTYGLRPAWYWTAFFLWMIAATPLSVWKTGSAGLAFVYLKSEFPMLFVIGGLAVTWRECRRLMHVLAASAVFYLVVAWLFARETDARLSMLFGTTANPNDLAAHQLLVLPFLFFFALDTEKPRIIRLIAAAGTCFGLYLIVATGSRGAIVALSAVCGLVLLRGSSKLRLAVLALIIIGIAVLPHVVPQERYRRLLVFTPAPDAPEEAVAGMRNRQELLASSLKITLQHPVFGAGPGQFMVQEDILKRAEGAYRGAWHETHNAYTQVSSECGIPALIFFAGGIISGFRLVSKIHWQAKQNPAHQQIAAAAFCAMLSFMGFGVAMFFLSMAYRFCFPALVGLSIAIHNTATRELAASQASTSHSAGGSDHGKLSTASASASLPRSLR